MNVYPTESQNTRFRVLPVDRRLSERPSNPLSFEFAPYKVIVHETGSDRALEYDNIHCPQNYVDAIRREHAPADNYEFTTVRE